MKKMAEKQRDNLIQIIIVIIIAIVGFALISLFLGGGMMGGGMMGGMGFGWIVMLLPLLFIIFLLYALSDRDRPTYNQSPYSGNENPIQILEQRYASGELSREEYFRIREDIYRR